MKQLKILNHAVLISFLILTVGCGKKSPVITKPVENVGKQQEWSHKRVQELFVVLFETNFAATEWKEIFDQTTQLSRNKKQIRLIEGQDDDASIAIRSQLIEANSQLLTNLGQKSLFMMSWSAQDENCKFVMKEFWQLSCKPRNRDNPLNGGLPHGVGAIEWVNPDPVVSVTKTPYLRIQLQKDRDPSSASELEYALELRLKEERFTESESWFKGEAFPAAGSVFLRADGSSTRSVFPFGYAELTLGK